MPNPGNEKREFVDFGKHEAEMDAFKVKWIYEALRQVELETNTYHKWLKQIDFGTNKAFTFLNTHGTIPDEATVKLTSKKYGGPGGQPKRSKDGEKEEDAGEEEGEEGVEDEDSDDEDAGLDRRALDKGEFDS